MKLRPPRRSRIVVTVAVLAMLAAACSSGSSAKSSAGTTGATSGSGAATTTTAPSGQGGGFNQAQFVGQPQIGGKIKFGLESNIATLDPAGNLAQPSDIDMSLAIYDPLITFDAKGNYAPDLATKWTNSPDLKTWTLTLRSGVQFTDGTPFNAQAVVDQFNRCKAPANNCTAAPSIAGDKVTAPNATTVVFQLPTPDALFLNTLTGVLGLIASPTAVAKYGNTNYARHPVGTGPFFMASYDNLILKRNPHYWEKDAQGRQLPYLNQITVVPITDETVRLQSLKSGAVDAIQTDNTTNVIDALKDKSLQIQKIDGSSATITIFNMRKPPFNSLIMREAVAYSINRNELNNVLYEGSRQLAYSAFATNSPFYADVNFPKYDPAKARKLVAEAKAQGIPTKFTTTCIATPEGEDGLAVTARDGKAVGMSGSNEFLDQGAYVNKVIGATHDFTVGCFRDTQIVSADGLYNVLHTGGSGNVMGYSNKTVDKDLEAIRQTTDVAEQTRLLKAIQVILAHDVPVVPLLYDLFANIHSVNVSGFPIPAPNSLGALKFATLYRVKQ